MNLLQQATGLKEYIFKNARHDIQSYTKFIDTAIELLKNTCMEFNVESMLSPPNDENDKKEGYYYKIIENQNKKAQKAIDQALSEAVEYVFDQQKHFQKQDEIKILDRSDEKQFIKLSKELKIEGKKQITLYIRPDTYQLVQQKKALNTLLSTPQPEHAPLLSLFGDKIQPNFSQHHIQDWLVLKDNDLDGTIQQRDFVQKALSTNDFALLEGPPGSGKTTAIIELILQFIQQGKRVLLCSATHAAIDNVIERVTEKYADVCNKYIAPVRIARTESSVSDKVRGYILKNLVKEYKKGIYNNLQKSARQKESQQLLFEAINKNDKSSETFMERIILEGSNLVAGTMVGILQHPDIKGNKNMAAFDVLIVDESSKVTFQEFIIPALQAKRWILVGDVKQLSPYSEDNYLAENIRTLLPDKNIQNMLVRQFELRKLILDNRHNNTLKIYFSEKDTNEEINLIEAFCRENNISMNIQVVDNRFAANFEKNFIQNWARINGADVLICWNSNEVKNLLSQQIQVKALFINGTFKGAHTPIFRQNYFHKGGRNNVYRFEFGIGEKEAADWADLVCQKMTQMYSFRNIKTEEFANIEHEYGYLMDSTETKEKIDNLRRLAFPSILELLQDGIKRNAGQTKGRILSDGFSDGDKQSRFVSLQYQHRMQDEIAQTSRENFYDDKNLQTANTVERREKLQYEPNNPVIWVSDNDQSWQSWRGQNKKITNPTETANIRTEIERFLAWAKENPPKGYPEKKYELAVLTFYLDQNRELRDMLRKLTNKKQSSSQFSTDFVHIMLYTVDKFQGQEADIVLLGFTKFTKEAHYNSPNRLNVALTRARFKLILFGNRRWLKENAKIEALRDLATNFEEQLRS
jgi:superfamily I DNA and/or RNA helicase